MNSYELGYVKLTSVLNMSRLPARLSVEDAVLLGFASHDITILMREELLKPLGRPAPKAPKWFAS